MTKEAVCCQRIDGDGIRLDNGRAFCPNPTTHDVEAFIGGDHVGFFGSVCDDHWADLRGVTRDDHAVVDRRDKQARDDREDAREPDVESDEE